MQRLVLISDATTEFPNNTSNHFKVRLPEPLDLAGQQWQASLWSLSLPDTGHSTAVVDPDPDTQVAVFQFTVFKRIKDQDSNDFAHGLTTITKHVMLKEVMSDHHAVTTGNELWANLRTIVQQKISAGIKTQEEHLTRKTDGNTVTLTKTWMPQLSQEADGTLLLKNVWETSNYNKSKFGLDLSFALQFGLLRKKTGSGYELGPNLTYDYPTVDTTSTSEYPTRSSLTWRGESFLGVRPLDLSSSSHFLFVVASNVVYLSRRVTWRFRNFNHAYNKLVGTTAQTLMVYSDLVESTVVGSQSHPLLRDVQVTRTGAGRTTVEPTHRQWINMRSNRVETVEVQIATPSGPLAALPSGKTLVTIGLRRVNSVQ